MKTIRGMKFLTGLFASSTASRLSSPGGNMKKLLAVAALVLISTPAMAAVQIVNANGKLVGATGVKVGAATYNVSFTDGTCAEVYGTCAVANFDFKTEATALAAVSALYDQVLTGKFRNNPGNVLGCPNFTCDTHVNFGLSPYPETIAAIVRIGGPAKLTYVGYVSPDFSTTPVTDRNFARFALQATPAVPEPATWAIMLIGFSAIGGAARYRRRKTNLAFA